jgi:hypothetical protein
MTPAAACAIGRALVEIEAEMLDELAVELELDDAGKIGLARWWRAHLSRLVAEHPGLGEALAALGQNPSRQARG